MHPLQPLYDPQTTLIEMDDRGSDELLANAFQGWVDSTDRLRGDCEHDRLRGCLLVGRNQQLGDTCQGDGLLALEEGGKRFQTSAILGRLGHVGGKLSFHAHTIARALLDLRLMLCQFNATQDPRLAISAFVSQNGHAMMAPT